MDQCLQIVEANGLSDMVKVIRGKMEDIELPEQYVDIIISEWMVKALSLVISSFKNLSCLSVYLSFFFLPISSIYPFSTLFPCCSCCFSVLLCATTCDCVCNNVLIHVFICLCVCVWWVFVAGLFLAV